MKKMKTSLKVMIACGALIIAICAIITTVIKALQKTPSTSEKTEPIASIYEEKVKKNNNDFFPKNLDEAKIYSLIRIKHGEPFFKQELVSLIIHEVVTKGSFVNGKLSYWYQFQNNKSLNMGFKWTSSSGSIQDKTYNIKIII